MPAQFPGDSIRNPKSQAIFGAEISCFRLEKRYGKPILQKFKEAGLRNVTTYVQWATHLPAEIVPLTNGGALLDFDRKSAAVFRVV